MPPPPQRRHSREGAGMCCDAHQSRQECSAARVHLSVNGLEGSGRSMHGCGTLQAWTRMGGAGGGRAEGTDTRSLPQCNAGNGTPYDMHAPRRQVKLSRHVQKVWPKNKRRWLNWPGLAVPPKVLRGAQRPRLQSCSLCKGEQIATGASSIKVLCASWGFKNRGLSGSSGAFTLGGAFGPAAIAIALWGVQTERVGVSGQCSAAGAIFSSDFSANHSRLVSV